MSDRLDDKGATVTATTPVETPKYGPDADPDKANRPPPVTPFLLTLGDRTTDEVKDHWPALILPKFKKDRDGLRWAFRNVHPDLTSTHGYRWPFPGHWAESHVPAADCVADGQACPTTSGGLCLARTIRGSLSGDCKLGTSLICGYFEADLLGSEESKFRVRKAWVGEVIGTIAELTLGGANLRYADLRYADLRYANLGGANLGGADLRGANLGGANLRYANLRYADLRYADLRYANLGYANLRYADLRYANLGYANLGGANLGGADLGYANRVSSSSLAGARYSQLTLWPDGFDPKAAGAVLA